MSSVFGTSLPPQWQASRVKHLMLALHRGTAPNYADQGPVRAVSQGANQLHGLDWSRTRFHDFAGDPTKLKGYLHPRDILINSTGTGTLGRVGYFTQSPDETPCMADGHVTVARADASQLDPRFCYYWFGCTPFQEYLHSALSVGSTNQIELNRERLGDSPIPLPPLEEQRRIADFLDAETALADHLTSTRNKQLKLLEERKRASLSEALAPGILTAPENAFPFPWLPSLPAERPLVKLAHICRLQNGLVVDSSRAHSEDPVTRPYLRVANVQSGYVDLSSTTEITVPRHIANRSTLQPGDVLMTEGGDLDKLGRGTVWRGEIDDCLHQNHVFALRPDPSALDPEYLAFMTQTVHGRCYFESTGNRTTNLASTSSSKILSFPIPLPSLSTQKELVNSLNRELLAGRQVSQKLTKQLALLTERRQALITAAVTGQFDVSTASGRNVTD